MKLFGVIKWVGAVLGGTLAYALTKAVFEEENEEFLAAAYTPIPMKPNAPAVFSSDDTAHAAVSTNGPAAQAVGEASFTFTLPMTIEPATVDEYKQKTYQVEVKEGGSGKPVLPEGPDWIYQIVDAPIQAGDNTVRLLYNPVNVPSGSHCVLLVVRIKVKDQAVKQSYSGVAAVVITRA